MRKNRIISAAAMALVLAFGAAGVSAATKKSVIRVYTRFIVLPNVMYGDRESAVYGYNFKFTEEEKAARRRSLLRTIVPG
jgi:predicted secreted acid phosphatase